MEMDILLQVLTGEQEFSELAGASGFDIDSFIQPN